MKKLPHAAILGCIIFAMVTACATTHHGVEISNVRSSSIKEIYIRNTGTISWGTNMAGNLQNIDKSRFFDRVDIRVIDSNGVVYSKYNVPFDDAAFVVTDRSSSIDTFGAILIIVPLVLLGLLVGV